MTVSTNLNRMPLYDGNDVTTTFAYSFPILSSADLLVTLIDADGVETVQELTTDYSVTGVYIEAGGTVIMVTAPATGEQLLIERAIAFTQPTDLKNQASFAPLTHERAFDRLAMQAIQLRDQMNRSAHVRSSADPALDMTLPDPEALGYWRWNATADAIEYAALSEGSATNFLAEDGTAAAPAYAFSLATGTGMYRTGAGALGFAVAGVLAGTLASSGFTAVGTLSGTRVLVDDGTAALPSMSFTADPNTGIYSVGANQIGFSTSGNLEWLMDTGGRLISNYTASILYDGASQPGVQTHGTSAGGGMALNRWSANTSPPTLYFAKSRGAAIGTHGAVLAGDVVGSIRALASNGADFSSAIASIEFEALETVGATYGGAITFNQVPTGSATMQETARFADGLFLVGHTSQIYGVGHEIHGKSGDTSSASGLDIIGWNGAATEGGTLGLLYSRGSSAGAYTAVQAGDALGTIYGAGANATTFLEGPSIRFIAEETFGPAASGSGIVFKTNPPGGTSSPVHVCMTGDGALITGSWNDGIGVSAPLFAFHEFHGEPAENTAADTLFMQWEGGATNGGQVYAGASRGASYGTYSALQSGDVLGIFGGVGSGTTQLNIGGGMRFIAEGIWTDASAPTYITFNTVPSGSTVQAERMRLTASGRLLLNTATDDGTTAFQCNGGALFNNSGSSIIVNGTGSAMATTAIFAAQSDTTTSTALITASDTAGASPALACYRSRGTSASRTAAQTNDILFNAASRGYGATGFAAAATAQFQFAQAENATDSAHGTYFRVRVTPTGSVTVATAFTLSPAGDVYVGVPSTSSGTHITNSKCFVVSDAATKNHFTARQQTADATGPIIAFNKTRGTNDIALTRPSSGDSIGNLNWTAPDSVSTFTIAQIRAVANATTGTGDLPTRMIFATTPDGSTTLTDAMSIDERQNLIMGATGAPGATAQKNIVLSNAATEATTSVDLVHVYAKDISAGNCALAVYAEAAINVDPAGVSTHSVPFWYNGTAYKILVKT